MSIPGRIEQIKTMLEKEPDDAFLSYALATEYVAIGELEQARILFERLIHKNPNYIATYYHLAKLYEKILLSDLAVKMYEKGIEVASQLKDLHAKSELLEALNNLLFDYD